MLALNSICCSCQTGCCHIFGSTMNGGNRTSRLGTRRNWTRIQAEFVIFSTFSTFLWCDRILFEFPRLFYRTSFLFLFFSKGSEGKILSASASSWFVSYSFLNPSSAIFHIILRKMKKTSRQLGLREIFSKRLSGLLKTQQFFSGFRAFKTWWYNFSVLYGKKAYMQAGDILERQTCIE